MAETKTNSFKQEVKHHMGRRCFGWDYRSRCTRGEAREICVHQGRHDAKPAHRQGEDELRRKQQGAEPRTRQIGENL